ncbi:MAG: hypothetical protein ACE14S_06925 [Candidatus Bathyarchaeia archaeon]
MSGLENDAYVLGEDYYTRDNQYWGICGEEGILDSLRVNFKKRDGFTIKHNNFSNRKEYASGSGMDLIVQKLDDDLGLVDLAQIEVKNLKEQPKPYGIDYVKRHILPRTKDNSVIKILVITFLVLLSQPSIKLLKQSGWTILEVGERITSQFYKSKFKYALANKLKSIISKIKPKSPLFLSNYKLLTNYTNTSNTNKITEQHDTPSNIELTIDNLKHPQHKSMAKCKFERLEKKINLDR